MLHFLGGKVLPLHIRSSTFVCGKLISNADHFLIACCESTCPDVKVLVLEFNRYDDHTATSMPITPTDMPIISIYQF